ncbi:MAG: hypothetical protein FWD66_04455 [Paludibacter sp.]|nr:hypothetical protein [Paludibacter sp.]
MKKTILLFGVAICSFLLFSCGKKAATETTAQDTIVSSIDTLGRNLENTEDAVIATAKEKLEAAKQALADAKAKGDKMAEDAAQKALNEAQAAWDAVKNTTSNAVQTVKNTATDIKNAAQQKVDDVKEKATQTIQEAKDKINEGVDKLKVK